MANGPAADQPSESARRKRPSALTYLVSARIGGGGAVAAGGGGAPGGQGPRRGGRGPRIAAGGAARPDGPTPAGALPPTAAGTSGPGAPGGDLATDPATMSPAGAPTLVEVDVPPGSHPHDVAPAADGTVWYTAQASGALGRLDPRTGETHHVPLGPGSSPHGVIIGPDGAPWVTDSGPNAIVRVEPSSEEVQRFSLPLGRGNANLNTAAFDADGILWFTGQSGVYGRLDPQSGEIRGLR